MAIISPTLPTIGQPNSTEDPDILSALTTIRDEFNGNIDNANIKNTAAIAYAKLALGNSIQNSDVKTTAAIAYSKLALANSIVNADINTAAAIAWSKIATTGVIATADLADDAVNEEKLSTGVMNRLGVNEVSTTRRGKTSINTTESTTSTTFADLPTAGPIVTVTVPSNGIVCIWFECDLRQIGGGTATIDLQEDGSTLTSALGVASNTSTSFITAYPMGDNVTPSTILKGNSSFITFATGAGSHNYKMVYKRTGGTSAEFQNRRMTVFTMAP